MTSTMVLEIFKNLDELMFNINNSRKEDEFSLGVFRVLDCRYRPLLACDLFAETREKAIDRLRDVLEEALKDFIYLLSNSTGNISRLMNPDNKPIDLILEKNQNHINQILKRLETETCVITSELFVIEE